MLVYAPQAQMEETLDQLQAFGVDRIRVSVFWKFLAPANEAKSKPSFDATDPAGYQQPVWAKYDNLIRAALARGILVNLNFTSPIPRWAAGDPPASRQDLQETWGPNPEEFGKFVQAVGKRYSGTYQGLPRIDYWSIWNEPNQAGWLTPQWAPDPRKPSRRVESAPSVYRSLLATAWQGLAATGHGTDTILVGETAPQGQQEPQGRDAVDRRAALHPPRLLPRRQPEPPEGHLRGDPRVPGGQPDAVRRGEPRPLPRDRLGASPLRHACAAGDPAQARRLGDDGQPRRPQPRAAAHLRALRPEDADDARRAALPHRVRLPDARRTRSTSRSTSRPRSSTRPSTSRRATPTCAR